MIFEEIKNSATTIILSELEDTPFFLNQNELFVKIGNSKNSKDVILCFSFKRQCNEDIDKTCVVYPINIEKIQYSLSINWSDY